MMDNVLTQILKHMQNNKNNIQYDAISDSVSQAIIQIVILSTNCIHTKQLSRNVSN